MVILTEEDMAELPLPTTKNIEVVQFCPIEQLDPILLNRSYYVEPEATGARAYCLLRDALEQSGKVAIAQVALRQRESLAVVRARDGVLVLETLLWPDEVRDPAFGFLSDDVEVRPQELRMASSLIESMTLDFDPDEFHDSYREALQELVAAKTEGREIVQPEVEAPAGDTTSLADALRASLAAAKGGKLGAVPDTADEVGEVPAPRRPTGVKATGAKARSSGTKSGGAKAAAAKASAGGKASAEGKSAAGKTSASGKSSTKTPSAAKTGSSRASEGSADEAKTAQRRSRRAS
jgi:DNA end-binding protein Ku